MVSAPRAGYPKTRLLQRSVACKTWKAKRRRGCRTLGPCSSGARSVPAPAQLRLIGFRARFWPVHLPWGLGSASVLGQQPTEPVPPPDLGTDVALWRRPTVINQATCSQGQASTCTDPPPWWPHPPGKNLAQAEAAGCYPSVAQQGTGQEGGRPEGLVHSAGTQHRRVAPGRRGVEGQ